METFTVRDLRERTGDLVRACEQGKLSILTKRGKPLGITVPLDETLIGLGVTTALAVQLFRSHTVSLGWAARFAGVSLEQFITYLGELGVPVIDYHSSELEAELNVLE